MTELEQDMTDLEGKLHRIYVLANKHSVGEPYACPSACLIRDCALEVMDELKRQGHEERYKRFIHRTE